MSVGGVVFDFNGTLFWDTAINNASWEQFLKENNINIPLTDMIDIIHGKNNQQSIRIFFGDGLNDKDVNNLSIEKEKIYRSICIKEEPELAPGALSLLEFLKSEDFPMTIASASIPDNIDFYFDYLGMSAYFDRSKVVFNDGVIRSKPYPDYYLNAMKNIGVTRDETLVFEDSEAGIRSAENAGVDYIIIVNSNNDNYDVFNHRIIHNFNEIDREIFKRK